MAHPRAIRVAIIDDNRMVRGALSALISQLSDVVVVASSAGDTPEVTASAPDVILLDGGLGDQDSLRVVASLMTATPTARVIIMDLIPVNEDIAEFVNAGVCGFVLKDATFDEFVGTIRSVANGEKVLPQRMTESLFAQIARTAANRGREEVLDDVRMTPREGQVIELIGEGLSNKEIAQRLNIATHTVKSHVRNVMEKLALHTRLQIAAYSHNESRS